MFEGCGYLINVESPERFDDTLMEFLMHKR